MTIWPDDYLIPGVEPYHVEDAGIIYCADCRDILPYLPKADLILTDPPYGVKRDKGFEGFGGFGGFGQPIARRRYEDNEWDNERPDKLIFEYILQIGKDVKIFGGNFFADLLPPSTHWIFWDKLNTMPSFGDGELVWTNSTRKSVKKIICEYNGLLGKEDSRLHPTQKPLKLIKHLIDGQEIILDPFLGSGTTAVAAKELGRRFIGIEISETYAAIAVKRLKQCTVLPFSDEHNIEKGHRQTQNSMLDLVALETEG